MDLKYQDFLLDEFRSRRGRNPHYSLRAYARDLEMPASKLSQNLRGLCGISVAKAEKIAEKLQMASGERQLFVALVESQHARSRVARGQARKEVEKLAQQEKLSSLGIEKFSVVRDWHHSAIMEMLNLDSENPTPENIAGRLNLPQDLVNESISRLLSLEMIGKDEHGVLRPTKKHFEVVAAFLRDPFASIINR